ncbi:hypothetical protein FS842_006552 [Serendipita sp. 407]|nr:hypothetical protein FS842_006552 [Serendipita sp. 407]
MGNHNTNTASTTSSSSTGYYINPSSTSSSSAQIYHPPTLSTSNSAATLYQPASSSSTSQHSTTSNLTKSLLLGPSARRQFEGKEGGRANRENHHPRAKFSIGGPGGGGYTSGEGERGRGLGRKSVGGASGSSMGMRTSSRREVIYPREDETMTMLEEDAGTPSFTAEAGEATPRFTSSIRAGREESERERGRSRAIRRGSGGAHALEMDEGESAWLRVEEREDRSRRGRTGAVKVLN